jgi:hypothetical protein
MPNPARNSPRAQKRLIYWVCASRTGNAAYNIRTKTRREAARLRAEQGASEYAPPVKVILHASLACFVDRRCVREHGDPHQYRPEKSLAGPARPHLVRNLGRKLRATDVRRRHSRCAV